MENRESASQPSYQDKGFVAIGKKCCKDHTMQQTSCKRFGHGMGGYERLPLGRGETERGERERVCVNHDGTDFIGCQICSMNICDSGDNENLPHWPLVLTWCWH